MKYLDEFSDPELAGKLIDQIRATTSKRWAIMEVCGGQTHSIIRHGIDQLLPDEIEMIHGPGCPVCVTPLEIIDKALEIASRPDVIFCSFGDMLRVPGSGKDLFRIKSEGGDVRVVYSPLDALTIAKGNPDKQVVFFGIGFETTAPANAMTVYQAKRLGIKNFSLLVSHVLVPPAIAAINALRTPPGTFTDNRSRSRRTSSPSRSRRSPTSPSAACRCCSMATTIAVCRAISPRGPGSIPDS
jgi:hydrogenase expression/formation protein HypD